VATRELCGRFLNVAHCAPPDPCGHELGSRMLGKTPKSFRSPQWAMRLDPSVSGTTILHFTAMQIHGIGS